MRSTPLRILISDPRSAKAFALRLSEPQDPTNPEPQIPNPDSNSRLLMDVPRQGLHVLQRRGGQNAVAEIEDVSGPPARPRKDIVGRRENALERAEQQRRIQIALNAAIGSDARPRFV